ncbi:hypothetical protein [Nitratifractor sp.]
MLIAWTTLILDTERGLPRDELGYYLPGSTLREAIENAWIFYWIKKDKALEKSLRKHLLGLEDKAAFLQAGPSVRERVLERYPQVRELEIPERIELPAEGLRRRHVELFDPAAGRVVEDRELMSFRGVIGEVAIDSPYWSKIKTALLSYARALAEYEHKELKETYLAESCAEIQNRIANEWEATLRLGCWSPAPHGGELFFFWRFPELRHGLKDRYGVELLPETFYIISGDRELLGWSEYRSMPS